MRKMITKDISEFRACLRELQQIYRMIKIHKPLIRNKWVMEFYKTILKPYLYVGWNSFETYNGKN